MTLSAECRKAVLTARAADRTRITRVRAAQILKRIREAIRAYRDQAGTVRLSEIHRTWLATIAERADALDAVCQPLTFPPDWEGDRNLLAEKLRPLSTRLRDVSSAARQLLDRCRLPEGRGLDQPREILERAIAEALVANGVNVTSYPSGTFGKIASQVYEEIGHGLESADRWDVDRAARRASNAVVKS